MFPWLSKMMKTSYLFDSQQQSTLHQVTALYRLLRPLSFTIRSCSVKLLHYRSRPENYVMPFQHLLRCFRTLWSNRWRCARYLLPATAIALTGCVATSDPSAGYASTNGLRDSYLSQTKADPLGAYLASRDIVRSTSQSESTALAATALNMLGIKYRFGGGAPSTGFDCSGLVIYAAEKSLGLKLPRQSVNIAKEGASVERSELQQGDLVFFNTRGHRNSHVGIYLGDKKFVHAPRSGSVVRVESMDIAYWRKRYNGARRLAPDESSINIASEATRLRSAR